MAVLTDVRPGLARDDGFFLGSAVAMTLVMVAGFSLQLAAGRSSFSAPLVVHAHAVVFFGWIFLYLTQTTLAATGRVGLHKRLGWIGAVWVIPMLWLGLEVTLALVQGGRVPFFFRPLQFLVFDPATLLAFAGLTAGAITLRRQTGWHRRLHFCGMALLLGPGFGRLLPLPLMQPWAWEATFLACLLFPAAGVAFDLKREGKVHPAWGWGIGAMLACFAVTEIVTYSPVGLALYEWATAGTAGATVAPLEFGQPPPMPAPAQP